MRNFSSYIIDEGYLAERALDAEMQGAAASSFDQMKKHLLKAYDDCYKKTWSVVSKQEDALLNRYGYEWFKETMDYPSFMIFELAWRGKDTVIWASSKNVPSVLVLPPSIKQDSLDKKGYQGIIVNFTTGLETAGGTYCGSKHSSECKAYPRISIKVGGNSNFMKDEVSKNIVKIAEMGRNKAYAEIAKFMANFAKDIEKLRPVYIHEYTHFLDDLRYKGEKEAANIKKGRYGYYEGDMVSYYKSNIEWNAHFNDGVSIAKDSVKCYLISATSDGTVYEAMKRFAPQSTRHQVDDVLNHPSAIQMRNTLVSREIERLWNERMDRLVNNDDKVSALYRFGDLRDSKDPYIKIVLNSLTETGKWRAIEHWRNDPKISKKFMSRIYSTSQDLRKMVKDYLSSVAKGTVPTSGDWTVAIGKMRFEYSFLYDGHFMKSRSTEVYKPKGKYYHLDYQG